MKMLLMTAGVCSVAAMMVFAAQNQQPGGAGRGPVSRLASALDADRDGTISSAEVRASSTAIRQLDANGDGRLDGEELRPALGPGGPRGGGEPSGRRGGRGEGGAPGNAPAASADELTETLMAFDRNGDNSLTRAEVPERFQGLFDRADADKDGVLIRDEIKQSAGAAGQAGEVGRRGGREGGGFGRGRGMGFDPLMRALDSDRDGVLSDAEIAAAANALTALDVNSDGQLSADEIRPAAPRGGRDGRFREERFR